MGQGSGSFTVSHLHNIASRRKGRKINSEHTASVRQPFSSFVRQYSESVLNCKLLKMILMWKWTPQTIFITMPIIELKVCLGGNAKYSQRRILEHFRWKLRQHSGIRHFWRAVFIVKPFTMDLISLLHVKEGRWRIEEWPQEMVVSSFYNSA